MAVQQIDGGRQIRSATITTTQLAAAAGIVDGQLATPYIKADGTRAFTANSNGGGFEATNYATPTAGTSLSTKTYVDTAVASLSGKLAAVAATNTETLTIVSGSVTSITGTTVDGRSPAVNDYVLIPNAPAATGAAGGATLSSQPANGLYQVTNNTTNLTLARAADMSGTINPMGASVVVVGGPTWGGADLLVTTPNTSAAFTYGTGSIAFTQMSGAGEITVDTTLTKTGNQIVRAAITGDVSVPSNSNTATIAAAAVTLAKQANLAANSVIGNLTGSAVTPVAVGATAAPTASTVVARDANANTKANSHVNAAATTVTAGATTTLTVASAQFQQFTGSSAQTVVLPDATTLVVGQSFILANRSTGALTVNMSGGANLGSVPGGTQVWVTVLTIGTAAGTWDIFSTTGGGALSATNFVTRETPTGTVNGSNTTFTLANTPTAGTEEVFLNGLLQEPGAGNDYTISGATITYLTAPVGTDKIRVNYRK